jgi:eukaryotic-like serine/threonine-protein kinase
VDLSVSDAPVGRLLDGRYHIEAAIARGGMATVYRALDTRLDRVVALKIMHPELATDGEFVGRFVREARAAAKLSHPSVVGVFDQGEDSGTVYLSMEYVEGRTLRQILREEGRLSPADALDMMTPVLAALQAAHEAGIVHCDVKPENILVGENGRIKVADFGLAKALTDPVAATGPLLGTVNYISPEQALGEPATPRSDVYSAGVVLSELLTGRPPHAAATDEQVIANHVDVDVQPPSLTDASIPAAVDELVLQATARDPRRRFAAAGVALEATEQVRASIDAGQGLESLDAAGVSVGEALTHVSAPPVQSDQHTSYLQAAPAAPASRTTAPSARRQARRNGGTTPRRAAGVPTRRTTRRPPRWRRILVLSALVAVIGGVIAGAWWLGEGRYVTTPSLLNLTVEEAIEEAQNAGLRVRQGGTEPSETFEAGRVMRTDPAPNERALRGVPIVLTTSSGPDRVTVPDVRGRSLEDATERIEDAGLVVEGPEEAYDNQVPEGDVISQGIAAGEKVKRGDAVPVVVSMGPEPLEITDYTGQEADKAERELRELGFDVVLEEQPHNEVRTGFVISQSPNSGTGVSGDQITLVVASQPDRIPVPNVIGRNVEEAERILSEAGFTNITIDERPSFWPQRQVVDQRPRPDREVRPDREIVLRVR